MAELVCAVCLYEAAEEGPSSSPSSSPPVVTIANGHALCAGHFVATKDTVSMDAGGIALAMIRHPGMRRG